METPSAKSRMLDGMSLLSDEPEASNIFFGFKDHAERVVALLESSKAVTPFSIAIHGEWGSGKTTLLDLVCERLSRDTHLIRFNAWEYERSGVVPSLLKCIEDKISAPGIDTKVLRNQIFSFAMDVLLRNSIGMTQRDARDHFTSSHRRVTSVRRELAKLVAGQNLVIIIDDLDRCTTDNVLSVLESVKMFLNTKNVTVVMAIDIEKVERAWALRYNSAVGKAEGREHAEKLFALKLSLPPKSREHMASYVQHHAASLDKTDVDFVLSNAQHNPRKIKRMLNLLYVILQTMPDRGASSQEIDDNFRADLKMVIAWIALTLNHPDMARKIWREPPLLVTAAVICNRLEHRGALLELLERVDKNKMINASWRTSRISVSSSVLKPDVYHLLRDIANEPPSLSIFQHFADQFGLEEKNGQFELNDMSEYDGFCRQLETIINGSGMVGV